MKQPQKSFSAAVWTPVHGVLADFFRFLRRPRDVQCRGLSASGKLRLVLTLFLVDFVLSIGLLPVLSALGDNHGIYWMEWPDWPLWKEALMVIVLAPLWEEAIFRGPLRYRGWYKRFVTKRTWDGKIFPILVWLSVLCFAALHMSNTRFEDWEPAPMAYVIRVVLVAPQFIAGLVLIYVRARLNFWWGWAYHGAGNGVILLLSYLMPTE